MIVIKTDIYILSDFRGLDEQCGDLYVCWYNGRGGEDEKIESSEVGNMKY